ncbi:hypothetical protein ABN028_17425 [Actinopolymorpha sp. B17G11]|uniref:hypothetical protein n=1 Tax=Actinopolymorpha sp. B17G11 TaxID=3160861 RepID=UPI0032E4D5B5
MGKQPDKAGWLRLALGSACSLMLAGAMVTMPASVFPLWVRVCGLVLDILALLCIIGVGVMIVVGVLALLSISAFNPPADLAIVGLLLLPILGWRLLFHVGRRIRHLPAVDTRLRDAAAGRLLWPDIALGLTVGAAIAVASAASGLPW